MYKQQSETQAKNDYKSLLIRSVTASIAGLILSLIILIILSVYLYFNPINEKMISIIAGLCKYFCIIVVAFISCINKRHSGYLRGALSACVFILISAMLYYSVYIESFRFINILYDLLIAGFLGLIAGAIAVNLNGKSR